MKRLSFALSVLGLSLLLSPGIGAAPVQALDQPAACAASDDPVPVDCPFCGGDPMLHVRRMNAIAVTTSRIAYQMLDASLF